MHEMKYGFVYVWRDSKKNMYYIGCHWGTENDGYICSSTRMRNAKTRRPDDFKRRVVQRIYTNRTDLLEAEYTWLKQIKDSELKTKYYNLSKRHFGHWSATPDARSIAKKSGDARRGKSLGPCSEDTRRKISEAKKGCSFSPEHREKLRQAKLGKKLSDEHKANIASNHKTKR